MTEKIYENDSYCREFNAVVESCTLNDGAYDVVLNRTAFFPEGGGQAPDLGFINDVKVLDVQIKDDVIIHKVESALEVGAEVTGKIDWDLRFSRMQSHTGEHIVSGIVNSIYGYSNTGFHMSESVMTVDFSGPLTQEDIEKIELESNLAVYKNASATATYPDGNELEKIHYRSKLDLTEGVRIVTIDGIDCCACCAPHVKATGEVGLIKIISCTPYKQGTRIEMIAGIHAYNDYVQLNSSNKALMGMLSVPRYNVKDAVTKQAELIQALRSDNQSMSRKLALYELQPTEVGDGVYAITADLSYDELRYCANALTEKGHSTCVLLSKNDEGYIYTVSSSTTDVRTIVKELNETFNGKGGGKPDYAQGKIASAPEDDVKSAIEKLLK